MRKTWFVVGALIVAAVAAVVIYQTRAPSPTVANAATQPVMPAPTSTAATQLAPAAASTATSSAAPAAASQPSAATAPATAAQNSMAQNSAAQNSTGATPAASNTPPAGSEPALYPDDMYLGKADAKLTIIEYASLSCPHCAKFNSTVLPRIKAEYIDKGLVRWVFRDYPLNREAFWAAILTHCGSPMRYFAMVDSLFQSQEYWATQPDPLATLKQIGVTEGVTEQAFNACLADKALKEKIVSRLQEASDKYKVDSTPSFLIKGKVHAGELPYDEFKKLIDDALGQS
jgi:protein-disulfide isomerase